MEFEEDLKINRIKINDELAKQASLFFFYSEEHAALESSHARIEYVYDMLYAEEADKIRTKYRNVKAGPSETAIKHMVLITPKIKELKKKLIKIESSMKFSRVRVEALRIKSEMLVSLSNNVRSELKSTSFAKT